MSHEFQDGPLDAYQKEQSLQIHVFERELTALPYGDIASARLLAEKAILYTSTVFFANRIGSISGGDFCVVYANLGRDNDWLRKRFRDHISDDYEILAEVGCDGEEVIRMPQLADIAAPPSFLFLVEGDGCALEEDLRNLWIRGLH